ncbi:amino acid adenylation domain-containing protein, partial [Pseudomonas sp. dw_612]|uniref:non-ribosomal peptide synthetase n=1 Tax=Pseudomonas sp. dw_612 TaxID=2720080 RepID=UPI001BD48672
MSMYSEKAGLDSTSDISDPSRKAGEGGGWEMPLSPAQQGVWFGQLLQPTSSTYNIAEYLQIHGQITPAIFVQALQEVLAEAPSLHLTFVDTGEGPVARSAVHEGWSLPIIDCSGEADPQTTAQAWMRADLAHLVDPAKGPLFGFALLQVAPDCFLFYQRYHHLIADGATRAMITRRLAQVYSALVTRHEPEPCWFADAEHLFSEAASYQASDEWHTDKQHWLDYLDSAPEPSSLSCRRTHDEGILRSSLYLTQAQTAGLKDMAQGHGVSMPQLLVALISIYLSRITGKNELIVGFPVAARHTTALRHTPGMLANVVPLRLALIREQGLSTLLRQVGEKITQALAHRRYPSEVLYRDLGLMARQESLFAHSISIEPFDYDCRFAGHSITPHNLANGPAADLNLFAFNRGTQAGIELHIDANAALYEMGDVQGHLEGLARLFQAVLDRPELPLGRFDLLGAPMRQLLLEDWNQTGTPYPDNLCIHQLFEQQVSCAPDASALVHDGQHLSYAELNARANRLAHHLRELGVTADTRVAICLERSLEQVVAVLAVLKAGGAYVPLDPAYPAERLADMLTDSDPCVLLTHGAALAPPSGTARIDLQTDAHHWATLPADNPSLDGLTARHLAYVIYTSGSTGQPKGVMVEHRGLVNLSRAQIALYGLTPASRVIQFASFSFDACVWEMVMALGAGATLYLPSEPQRQVGLFDYLTEHRITHATLPPALLQGRTDLDALDRLETLVLAGEAPSAALIQALGRRVQVHNAYGPTETTVCATDWACLSTLSAEPVSIGRPLPNTRAYVLDAHGEPVPVGVAGELWVGGVGVARGYLNREQLTAEQFKASPFLEGDRLYRTGDLVRYLADGNLEYLGRADQQVKIRGFRIELGEIETLLRGHPAVREAAVIARADDAGAKRLVAYVVPVSGDELSLAQTLRGHLQARLPDYMVPAAYVTLASLPLTTNGKLDQRALPAPDTTAFVQGAYEKPRGETEKLLAGIWQQLLGVER